MNRKMSILAVGTAILSIAVTAVTATSFSSYTPLYTARMEQASSEMTFLPTEMNEFTYTAENGYALNYDNIKYYCDGGEPLGSVEPSTCQTCWNTCPGSCSGTCSGWTCGGPTCSWTCEGGQC